MTLETPDSVGDLCGSRSLDAEKQLMQCVSGPRDGLHGCCASFSLNEQRRDENE